MKYSILELLYFFFNRLPKIIIGRYITRNLIRVHWGRSLMNFGDCLQPDTLKHYGLLPVYVPTYAKADIVLAGSILQTIPENFGGYIVGTGGDCQEYRFPNAIVRAVRGVLTRGNFPSDNRNGIALGDTGLLAPIIYPDYTPHATNSKKHKLGVILHFVEYTTQLPALMEESMKGQDVVFINVLQHPRKVVKAITECECIVSSSLHGLIIADSFHIPNRWIINRETMPTDFFEYKFHDYYSSLGLYESPVEISGHESIATLCSLTTQKPKEKINALITELDLIMKEVTANFKKK